MIMMILVVSRSEDVLYPKFIFECSGIVRFFQISLQFLELLRIRGSFADIHRAVAIMCRPVSMVSIMSRRNHQSRKLLVEKHKGGFDTIMQIFHLHRSVFDINIFWSKLVSKISNFDSSQRTRYYLCFS